MHHFASQPDSPKRAKSLRALGMRWLVTALVLGSLALTANSAPVAFLSDEHGACQPQTPRRLPDVNCQRPYSHFQASIGRFGLMGFGPPPLACEGGLHQAPQQIGCGQWQVPSSSCDFSPGPSYDHAPHLPCAEQGIYGGKYLVPVQRPLVEWGLPFYDNGPIPVSETWLGPTNLVQQKFYVYGDYRIGFAENNNLGDNATVLAHRLNLELDYWITSTERIHAFVGPFQDGGQFMRIEDGEFFDEFSLFADNTDTLFFEGDLGQILGGFEHTEAPFDMPFTVGLIPLFFQNGTWLFDQFWGAAVTLPAQNSPLLDWSNFDVTLFAALDQVSSDAFDQAQSSAHLLGATTMIEARGGYIELGYAYADDQADLGRSYHNLSASYTRRYLNTVSNSVRVFANTGQDGPRDQRSADGVLLLVENSFLTKNPYNVVPYVNFWSGWGNPQPAARAAAFGGVLFNTGILFQVDALTGYPTLDATGSNTYGAAVGVDLLARNFDQQLILEAAVLQTHGDASLQNVPGDQYGIGVRWQLPLTNAHLIRTDAMYGITEDSDDVSGARVEFRWKF